VVSHRAVVEGIPGRPTERHLELLLARVPELGLEAAAGSVGVRPRHFRWMAERDPEVFGLRLRRALEQWERTAKAAASQRPCAQCGDPFRSAREHARFCSVRCRKRAYRQRRAQETA
jgi:hypothetical protein